MISDEESDWHCGTFSGKPFILFSYSFFPLFRWLDRSHPSFPGWLNVTIMVFPCSTTVVNVISYLLLQASVLSVSARTGHWQRSGILSDAFCSLCWLGAGTILCTGCCYDKSLSSEYRYMRRRATVYLIPTFLG